MKEKAVNLQSTLEAQRKIGDLVTRTPTYLSNVFSQRAGAEVYLKLECFQPVGVFKVRGAINKISSLSPAELERGLVTASSGNHGLAVAYAAKIYGAKTMVVVPENAVKEKVEALESYGADIVKYGKDYDEAYSKALEIQKEAGTTLVHPFEDPFVIAGQGTIGLELLEDIPNLNTIIVPVGGGGLISGISIAAKTLNPKLRIVGVQSEGAPAVYRSWRAGKIVEVDSVNTVADGLAARKPLDLTFGIIKRYVDTVLLVSEEEIGEAVLALLHNAHILAEPSGAASLAALLFKYHPKPEEKVAVIISGANISIDYLASLLKQT
ncbi:MAG: threonine ammonia-lyase [Candidatus Bathyarchaeota archaeon]|nr:MAG: threonine ammonia-lyase [Candidatus Bathyarchaeota archaeon]